MTLQLPVWTCHFEKLNEIKPDFSKRLSELEEKLKIMETNTCFNELDFPISEAEISAAILRLKRNKSPGLDNISNDMIKSGHSVLLKCFKKYTLQIGQKDILLHSIKQKIYRILIIIVDLQSPVL